MTTTEFATPGVRPGQAAPDLTVPLLDGGTFRLADQHPERFTLVVFNRGLHCPVCQAQLREFERRLDELTERGVEVISVTGETRERAQRMHDEWKLKRLPIAYGLTAEQMRAWGLFISRGIGDDEPPLFNEPAVFMIDASGSVYYEAVLSAAVGRPRLDDLLGGIDYWAGGGSPPRGDA